MSSRTLSKSLEYIKLKRPAHAPVVLSQFQVQPNSSSCQQLEAMVILENIQKKGTEQVVSQELSKLQYVVQAFFANSASFGLPQSRSRLFVLAVDPAQCSIIHGPGEWRKWLEDWNGLDWTD